MAIKKPSIIATVMVRLPVTAEASAAVVLISTTLFSNASASSNDFPNVTVPNSTICLWIESAFDLSDLTASQDLVRLT